ncbi:vitamin K epoxide reductase family protein [Microbacterium sp. NIBRBAC000506063]|uniref:vitamin K epoxide reductase family protein n=1 Tax=Microbacterium sp. NIBRBAC000506063 TaxID=2734618 RepID=UPI001BB7747D|nr:vitamin K epoxide reductase family protein [Microbacterium sp. NIBRBAC000506063]QTV80751.1 vitamin K epoxide reductase family protein [Microbacterium sp. NIBRBAC000506063]
MTEQRTRPTVFALWLIFAGVIGWWAAFRLTLEKFEVLQNPDAELGCDFSVLVQCKANLEAWQGSVFGFPNPLIGLAGWIAPLIVGGALLAGARFARWFWALFGVGMLGAFAFVCWLIGQSIFVIGTLCPWCMVTWAVTIPTFIATVIHLFRNGTLSSSTKVQDAANRLMGWTPVFTVVAFAIIAVLAQLRLNVLGML